MALRSSYNRENRSIEMALLSSHNRENRQVEKEYNVQEIRKCIAESSDRNNNWFNQLVDILHIGRWQSELVPIVNNVVYHGNLHLLKDLIRAGANPKKSDSEGRSPLHIAASRGHKNIAIFLLQMGVNINATDKYGCTPLLEAIKCEQDSMIHLLFKKRAKLGRNAGTQLCEAVSRGDLGFVKRVLSCGVDPNSKGYDYQTPLHISVCEGFYLIAEVLLEAGARVLAADRYGTTPLKEAQSRGSLPFIELFEKAKSKELSEFAGLSDFPEPRGKTQRRIVKISPFHPWWGVKKRGLVMCIPETMEEIINTAKQRLKCSGKYILSEDGNKIFDLNMISDGQRVYMPSDSELAEFADDNTST